jgi:hypothetical protein
LTIALAAKPSKVLAKAGLKQLEDIWWKGKALVQTVSQSLLVKQAVIVTQLTSGANNKTEENNRNPVLATGFFMLLL